MMDILAKVPNTVKTRAAIGDTIYDLSEVRDDIWIVTPDIGAYAAKFKEKKKNRFIDTGISEQSAVGISAGLALSGNTPFVLGMAPFLSMRSCEQIRTAVCYHNLPVRFIATNSGTATNSGSTHYGMEDISILKSFVNMTVISISDPYMICEMIKKTVDHPGPIYFRLARANADPVIYEPNTVEYEIGASVTIADGHDVTIMAHGEAVQEAIKAADQLKNEGISVRLIDMYSIKPLDTAAVRAAVTETGALLVMEDHLTVGGLASSIADYLADSNISAKNFHRLGVPQVYPGFGGTALRAKYGFDAASAVKVVHEMLCAK